MTAADLASSLDRRSERPYLSQPTLSGERLVVRTEDDLWLTSTDGGEARRLTASRALTSRPRLSPDGELLAYVSQDSGQAECWVMPSTGGRATQVTDVGMANTTVSGWTPDGRVIVSSSAGQPFKRWVVPVAIDVATKWQTPLGWGPVIPAVSYQPGGDGVVLGRGGADPARWKRYRGGTAGQIWVDRKGNGSFRRILPELTSDLSAPMWVGRRIYFLSDHEGIGNLYSVRPGGADLRRHTDHDEYYARFATTDGTRIVYQHAGDIWLYDPETDNAGPVPIEVASPRAQLARRFVPAEDNLTAAAVSPDGSQVVVEARGQLTRLPLWEDAPRRLAPADGVRQRAAAYLPDGQRVVAVSDAGGEEHLVVVAGDGAVTQVATADRGEVDALVPAPAGDDRVVLTNERHELLLVDLGTGETTVLDRSEHGSLTDPAWSPDGRWVAYSCARSRTTTSVMLTDTRGGAVTAVTAVTRPEFKDSAPTFSPDGRYLYFLSSRIFDPVLDELFMDLNFPRTIRPYVVPLRAGDRSPFLDRPHGQGRGGDAQGTGRHDQPKVPAAPDVTVDLDGVDHRAVAVPVDTGRYLAVQALPDALLLLCADIEGQLKRDIFDDRQPSYTVDKVELPSGKRSTLHRDVAWFHVSADRSTILYRSQKRLRVLPAGAEEPKDPEDAEGTTRRSGWLDLNRIRLAVDPAAEWRQIFVEAWRWQRDFFWDADMSGVDWALVRARYEPLLARLGARSELGDVLWELQGELGTSHAYEIGGDYRPAPKTPMGYLGADLERDDRGRWRIASVLYADTWEPGRGSPLAAPGVEVSDGDRLLAVDGIEVDATTTPQSLLAHRSATEVELTVADGRGRKQRTVVVTTVADEEPLRYRQWVEGNRRYVRDASDGRIGYLHLPDMGTVGYAEFHRSYLAELDSEALLVDVRNNAGGFVSQLLLEKLRRRPIGYDVSRYGLPEPYPADSPAGPMICTTNELAGSDGDIFSHCWKLFGLGTLVGTRTWGGVIGINGRHRLVDGGLTTQPEYSFWFADVGWGVENYGTDPDVVVDRTPQDWASGAEPQLDTAIRLLLRELKKYRRVTPDTPRTRLDLPRLPPRG